jgi:hypothetical protein
MVRVAASPKPTALPETAADTPTLVAKTPDPQPEKPEYQRNATALVVVKAPPGATEIPVSSPPELQDEVQRRLVEAKLSAGKSPRTPPKEEDDNGGGRDATLSGIDAGKQTIQAILGGEEGVEEGLHAQAGPGRLMKGLAVVGAIGGGLTVADGVEQIANGETAEGTKNVTSGGMGTAAAIGELVWRGRLAGTGVPLLAGGAAIVDGGYGLVKGIQEHDTEGATVGGVKAVGGALIAASPFVTSSVIGVPLGVGMATVGTLLVGGAALYDYIER